LTNEIKSRMTNALDLIEEAILDLESKLNLSPRKSLEICGAATTPKFNKIKTEINKEKKVEKQKKNKNAVNPGKKLAANLDQPEICKLEFKVGIISKVWVHPDADKLYCEEIDCGEDQPRRIASGLRLHYDEKDMLGQRLLVVSNLKPKNLVGFKSFGMVLCASLKAEDGTEKVEFIEPPEEAPLGEVITFEGLPPPEPFSPAQIEKRKVFAACMKGMKTTDECLASWNNHIFLTSKGPCKSKTIKSGDMR